MAKISNKAQKVFAGVITPSGNIAQFGSDAASAQVFSGDPDVLQALAAFGNGWSSAVVGNKSPDLEDFNGLHYLQTRQLAYLRQEGIGEWKSDITYYTDSIVKDAGDVWVSKIDNNTGNATTDTNKWKSFAEMIYTSMKKLDYPVGEILITRRSGSPDTWLGFGTWVRHGAGKVPIFYDASDSDFNAVDKTGGAKTVALTGANNGPHAHTATLSGSTDNAGNHTHGVGSVSVNIDAVGDHAHDYKDAYYAESAGQSPTGDYVPIPDDKGSAAATNFDNVGWQIDRTTFNAGNHSHTANLSGFTDGDGAHTHVVSVTGSTDSAGSGTPFNILPPFTVVFAWKRTA